jgi:hypothetical protein
MGGEVVSVANEQRDYDPAWQNPDGSVKKLTRAEAKALSKAQTKARIRAQAKQYYRARRQREKDQQKRNEPS